MTDHRGLLFPRPKNLWFSAILSGALVVAGTLTLGTLYVATEWVDTNVSEGSSFKSPRSVVTLKEQLVEASSTPPSHAASNSTAAVPDFDFDKRDKEIAWCREHGARPVLTFVSDQSNVVCVRTESVVAFPPGL